MKTREQKAQERAERFAQLECDRAAFFARMEAERQQGKMHWTPADQLEAQRLLLVGAPSHPQRGNCFMSVPGSSIRIEAGE
jgi:hypothetical protein